MKRLSVVIANYNYERFVAEAIESALALRWDDIEVVVVDDGSTDGSRGVIERYEGRAKVLLTDNASQRVAVNRGFAATTGDVVIFLDSDDVLPPDLPGKLAASLTSRACKAQFQMQRIDEQGHLHGSPFPLYRPVPSPTDIRRWAARTTAYPTPPGSGNAYARWFLEQIFPLDESIGDFADSGCLAAAPFFGDVITVPGVLVGYRQHDGNDSDLMRDAQRFPREVARARARWRFAKAALGDADPIDERPLRRSRELLQLRVATRRLVRTAHPLPDESLLHLVLDCLTSPFHPGPEPLRRRVLVALWGLSTLLTPAPLAHLLVSVRYGRRG